MSLKGFSGLRHFARKALSFEEYVGLIDRLLAEGKTTGPIQSQKLFEYGRLNRHRLSRLAKTFRLDPVFAGELREFERPLIWLVITEGWCGDAVQSIPVIEAAAAQSVKIETRYLLRDENPGLMDRYLTNGRRSIPILISIDRETYEETGVWGARPAKAQEYFLEMTASGFDKALVMENLQRWYLKDRQIEIQKELRELLSRSSYNEWVDQL